jgi:hypothetical protein
MLAPQGECSLPMMSAVHLILFPPAKSCYKIYQATLAVDYEIGQAFVYSLNRFKLACCIIKLY